MVFWIDCFVTSVSFWNFLSHRTVTFYWVRPGHQCGTSRVFSFRFRSWSFFKWISIFFFKTFLVCSPKVNDSNLMNESLLSFLIWWLLNIKELLFSIPFKLMYKCVVILRNATSTSRTNIESNRKGRLSTWKHPPTTKTIRKWRY